MILTTGQYRLRKFQFKRRREIGELEEWEYHCLMAGLRACMTEKPEVPNYGRSSESRLQTILGKGFAGVGVGSG